MGLGKTVQVIALLLHEQEQGLTEGPTLLVCPVSLVGNWQRELARFAPSLRVLVHHGATRATGVRLVDAAGRHDVVILEQAFASAGVQLFPYRGEAVPLHCTCSEPRGCPHVRALATYVAAVLDASPFLWLEVLGLNRESVLASVRAQMEDCSGPAALQTEGGTANSEQLAATPTGGQFWVTDVDPNAVTLRVGHADASSTLLCQLGPFPLAGALASVGGPTRAPRPLEQSLQRCRA